jgi:hypothetical protein
MEIVNRRMNRIYTFEELLENIKEIIEKDLTFIISWNKLLHTYMIGDVPIMSRDDFVCKLLGWSKNGLIFKNTGNDELMLRIYNIDGKLYTCGYIDGMDTRIEIPDIFEVYMPDRD